MIHSVTRCASEGWEDGMFDKESLEPVRDRHLTSVKRSAQLHTVPRPDEFLNSYMFYHPYSVGGFMLHPT